MRNSILLGNTIYNILTSSDAICNVVNNRIFPIVAENDTPSPFIVFTRTNVYSSVNTKDGYCNDVVTFQISIVANSYKDSVEIANMVRNLFEVRQIGDVNLTLYDVHMTSINEQYNTTVYIQTMNFECEVI